MPGQIVSIPSLISEAEMVTIKTSALGQEAVRKFLSNSVDE